MPLTARTLGCTRVVAEVRLKAVVASSQLAGCHCQGPSVSVESGVIWKTINSELPYIVRH